MIKKTPERFNSSLIDYIKDGILKLKSEVEMGPLLEKILDEIGHLSEIEKNLVVLQINSILGEKGIDFQLALDEDGKPYFYTPESVKDLDELQELLDAA